MRDRMLDQFQEIGEEMAQIGDDAGLCCSE